MKSVLVLTWLCMIGVTSVFGTSKRVLDFLIIYNGIFDNELQTKEVGDDHDFIQDRLIPVDVKCLRPKPAIFVEKDANNVTMTLLLVVVKDGIGDTVTLTSYSFTDASEYKPGEFKVENLSDISCDDLLEDKDCYASYRVMREGAFGNFPYCSVTVNGQHPRVTCMHQCTTISSTVPMNLQLRSPMEPYEVQLRSQKFPLINPPADYVAPCGN